MVDRLDDLDRVLDQWRGTTTEIRIRCAKCRRVFGRAAPHHTERRVVVEGETKPGERPGADWPRKKMWTERTPATGDPYCVTFRCGACGTRRRYPGPALLLEWLKAATAGRTEVLVVGLES